MHNYETCSKERRMSADPLQPQSLPDRPWQRIAADLFLFEVRNYLLTVDYYSRYTELDLLPSTTSSTVIDALSAHFARHGLPEVFVSDNSPQFASTQFATFLSSRGVEHRTSSPRHPQSNGMAERAVRTIKGMLWKTLDHHAALLTYRFTPASRLLSR